jgi:hypothetical protein
LGLEWFLHGGSVPWLGQVGNRIARDAMQLQYRHTAGWDWQQGGWLSGILQPIGDHDYASVHWIWQAASYGRRGQVAVSAACLFILRRRTPDTSGVLHVRLSG